MSSVLPFHLKELLRTITPFSEQKIVISLISRSEWWLLLCKAVINVICLLVLHRFTISGCLTEVRGVGGIYVVLIQVEVLLLPQHLLHSISISLGT